MKKYLKLSLCGIAAVMLVAGCSKKPEQPAEDNTARVTKLGDYKGVEVSKASTEVTDEELEARIQSILTANPEYIEITDRAAQNGDVVDIDYVGMKDGVAFEGGTDKGYKLKLGSGSFIEGFEEGLVGARTGDELSLNLTFPEDYGNQELAGAAVVFDVTVNGIEEVKDAALDNNFVQRMSDFTNVDEWKADTLADMEAEKETQADQQLESDALFAAVANSEFHLNDEEVEEQYNNQLDYYTSMMQAYGMTLENYASMYGMSEDDFKAEIRTAAENAIKQQLLVKAIAEKENMQVEDADRQFLADQYGMTIDKLKETYGEEAVDETAMMYKVVGFIKDNAVIK